MKEQFESYNFRGVSEQVIDTANQIIAEYTAEDMKLTLRQLYYQFIARNAFPQEWFVEIRGMEGGGTFNCIKNYNRFGRLISKARKAGLVDWSALEDAERPSHANPHWRNPGEILISAAHSFRLDHWKGQYYYVEVVIEKRALINVIAPVCRSNDVRFCTSRGFSSDTQMYEMAKRMETAYNQERAPVLLHLADHDPSGMEMTEDIRSRLWQYSTIADAIMVDRIALNMAQVRQFTPPPNPAKESDSRFEKYEAEYGSRSWELDAIELKQLQAILQAAIDNCKDFDIWDEVEAEQKAMKARLLELAQEWDG